MKWDSRDLWCLFWGFLNVTAFGLYGSILALIIGLVCVLLGTIGVQRTYLKNNPRETRAEDNDS